MKTEIIKLLKHTDNYVSGQEICEQFGVSRTAVWKVMNQLKEEGYEIESVPKKGYRLLNEPDVLSKSELLSRVTTEWAGRTVYYFDETGSTNNDVRRLMSEGAPHGTLAVADKQTAGKGRRGRTWISPAGANIFMSLGLRPEISPDKASMLTLVMALAVCDAIRETTRTDAKIKWPNDIVVNGKKVCGMLTELEAELDCIHSVVVGIGINVNQTEFASEISQTATSLLIESGNKVLRALLVERVLHYFEKYYAEFMAGEDLSALREAYNERLVNLDKDVRVLDPKGEYDGIARGIDEQGQLLVEKDGETVKVYAGEVSVRGVYGYV
ncbi:MAG: biotin--[acetyl-CoA-carboxylase] ligase [Lachnospiraceae bacterium]|jgi:BirA family biotin operon repressor/biotin-[acetyl-CoA-carboxylase] ligase|nr:biotin--[acetyl-CoA-carboxylase] ligase [Lachnospiraceae bacterium]